MKISHTNLLTALRGTAYLALACVFLIPASLQAQSSSSSYDNNQGYNGQTYNNSQYNNPTYNNRRTPRYTGHNWTDHLVFEGGAGVTQPASDTQHYANTGFNILLGTGLKFNDRLSLLAEWNFNYLGVPHTLAGVVAGTPGGNEHIWTVDLNPKFNFIHTDRSNAYVIGGGGFSRALTNFTVPVWVPCYFGYGYGYGFGYGYTGGCTGNVTVAHTSTNQANVDIGIGGEWQPSPYRREKLFLEARYEKLFSPNTGLPPGYNAALVPITFGVRW